MKSIEQSQNTMIYEMQDYRCLQLVASLFSVFREYWGYSAIETLDIFKQNNVYEYISDNYDFYHTVGKVYIVEDVCENLGLPTGCWTKQ